MAATMPLEGRYHRLELTNRWLLVITGIVLVALLGAVVVAGPQILRGVTGLTSNEQAAEQLVLGANPGTTKLPGSAYAPNAMWVDSDGTVLDGAAAIIAAPAPPVTVTLSGDPVTVGDHVVVDFTWTGGGASGDGAFLITFNDAGKITFVSQTVLFK